MESETKQGWTKAFHPSGLQVTLPVTVEPLNYAAMFANVTAALEAGFLVQAPGLEEGEEREMVAYVLRGENTHDNKTTPTILLYSDRETWTNSFLKIYFNKDEQIDDFEYASKMRYDVLPLYEGGDKPELGKSKKIIQVPKTFGVVYKKNPKYNEADKAAAVAKKEVYGVPKRLFVRWVDQRPKENGEQPAQSQRAPQTKQNGTPAKPQPKKPTNGKELREMLEKYDTIWTVQHHLGKPGDMVMHVRDTYVNTKAKSGKPYGADIDAWPEESIDDALKEANYWNDNARAAKQSREEAGEVEEEIKTPF